MEFFKKAGKKAIGSRLRMLTDKITEDAAAIYKLNNIDLQPKWFPVFYALAGGEQKTITGIAHEIGHSHPSVSTIVREMTKQGLIREGKDTTDARRTLVGLTEKGSEYEQLIQNQYSDVEKAIEDIDNQTTHSLWKAIEEWEYLLEQKSLLKRVIDQKKIRESAEVNIVNYTPKYAEAFRALNIEWISTYFKMEAADYRSLDDPEGYILNKGGHIFVALYQNNPVGVCALIKMNDGEHDFELAKMAVSPAAQGKNIGWLLGQAALNKAAELGGRKVYLESNTILKPAINLYNKLGFKKIVGHTTPYERCNIQMSVDLDKS